MVREYITSREYLPDDPEGEHRLQLTDAETKEIFETQVRIAKSKAELADPAPLVVRGGPHEDSHEAWYVELVESDAGGEIDRELLRDCLEDAQSGTDVINARSAELKAVLCYLVEKGVFESQSEAARSLLWEKLADDHRPLLRQLDGVCDELEESDLDAALGR
ncbi:uncharacterized protein NP_3412A [Natronomonas pharaonis DSM 2160]|uniref:Uncharacterized protein n=1 Tax=Natronomonas pharaonis (strain ATCC 35678 / DSM 2160 / CIP 103997 / JCM 8858 / NBRC 14720 / NCIMB 2260 / Gabara) TaxID=348780 RepID=A0A1U7EXB4_NATPD|nr:hypothetical protein [Natronomonas pharaonis]CAI49797.1 uncharacterized protein NP_3412A [Natronomonas pharaonis DSM 2160]